MPNKADFGPDVPGTIHLCCRVREKVEINTTYMQGFSKSIVARASFQGPHAISDDDRRCGSCKAIPLRTALSIGMFVKLTLNIDTDCGLCNGSRGIVRDILYEGGGYDPSSLPVVIVEFPRNATIPFLVCCVVRRWASPWSARILQYGRCMLAVCCRFRHGRWSVTCSL